MKCGSTNARASRQNVSACAVTKMTKNPAKKPGEKRNMIGAAVRKAGGSLWEHCSYDVAGKFATPAVNGGGQHEFHAACHMTSTHCVAGFAQMRDLHAVMEDFLATAAAQEQEMERGMNLLIDAPEGHRTKKCTKMKSDFFGMHRSQRMQTIMHEHGRTQMHTAPEKHHEMGKQERFMRTVHEAANAMMEAANLPPKCRLEAVKAAVRRNDHLGTKGNPEERAFGAPWGQTLHDGKVRCRLRAVGLKRVLRLFPTRDLTPRCAT